MKKIVDCQLLISGMPTIKAVRFVKVSQFFGSLEAFLRFRFDS